MKKGRRQSKKYITFIHIDKRKKSIKNHNKLISKNKRSYLLKGQSKSNITKRINKIKDGKLLRLMTIPVGISLISIIVAVLGVMYYLKFVTTQLPSPDNPFKNKPESTFILASNTNEKNENEVLYTIFGDENRETISIEEVPDHVKWTVLAAEDIDFYNHRGFDLGGIYKAFLNYSLDVGSTRGGSTITQQLVKQTTLTNEQSIDRKLKELGISIEVERKYSKDEILEMYLNVNNYGSNIYGIGTAAKFYFGKNIKDLTLAEAATLAQIPRSPVYYSPTLAPDPNLGKQNAFDGRNYVLKQMENNLEKINSYIENDDNIILKEEIEAAKHEVLVYKEPRVGIKSPHFVFYVEELLTKNNYNNGKPFELAELQTGGYKIYTTLDTNIQKIAEEEVVSGIDNISSKYGGYNGAAVITRPSTGDVLAMVGSKDYNLTDNKYIDGQVNITTSLQSMGSTMKPFVYYKAFQLGIVSPGSYLPDVPVNINGYKPQNWDTKFKGNVRATPRMQLRESRNTPPIMLVDQMGVNNYIDTMVSFGYQTIDSRRSEFGHSIVLGGGEVTMLEHAQGYGVFANNGNLVEINPITKITRTDPKTHEEILVYERVIKKVPVADHRAVYMVNHILNYKNGGPGQYVDGRDYAGKTGTSELHKDNSFVGYTPDFVIVGWNGNNQNQPMAYNSWGENVPRPWVIKLSQSIASYFPEKTPFQRPGGLTSYKSDIAIEGIVPDEKIFSKYGGTKKVVEKAEGN